MVVENMKGVRPLVRIYLSFDSATDLLGCLLPV